MSSSPTFSPFYYTEALYFDVIPFIYFYFVAQALGFNLFRKVFLRPMLKNFCSFLKKKNYFIALYLQVFSINLLSILSCFLCDIRHRSNSILFLKSYYLYSFIHSFIYSSYIWVWTHAQYGTWCRSQDNLWCPDLASHSVGSGDGTRSSGSRCLSSLSPLWPSSPSPCGYPSFIEEYILLLGILGNFVKN